MAADLSDYDETLSSAFELSLSDKQDKTDLMFDFAMSMDVISEININNQESRQWLETINFEGSS